MRSISVLGLVLSLLIMGRVAAADPSETNLIASKTPRSFSSNNGAINANTPTPPRAPKSKAVDLENSSLFSGKNESLPDVTPSESAALESKYDSLLPKNEDANSPLLPKNDDHLDAPIQTTSLTVESKRESLLPTNGNGTMSLFPDNKNNLNDAIPSKSKTVVPKNNSLLSKNEDGATILSLENKNSLNTLTPSVPTVVSINDLLLPKNEGNISPLSSKDNQNLNPPTPSALAAVTPKDDSLLPQNGGNVSTLSALSHDIQSLWNSHKHSVVKVIGIKKESKDEEKFLFGTGFFADQEGNILTTAMMATEAEHLGIEYQRLYYEAKVIGKDSITNLAVIQLHEKPQNFKPIPLFNFAQNDITPEGSFIVSIGCALGMDPAPTLGLITGKDLIFGDHVFATTYLRSNISVCGGESGAPVFDSDDHLCGVLIVSLPELHSSFIIPTAALGRVFNDIIQNKSIQYSSVQYSSAGFNARNQPTSEFGKTQMIISSIQTSTIQYQGTETLQIGDVLLKIEDKIITNERDIADILFFKKPKEHCRIEVLRDKKAISVDLILGEKVF